MLGPAAATGTSLAHMIPRGAGPADPVAVANTIQVEDVPVADHEKDLRARGVENQVKGSLKEAEGKIRGAAADAVDDESEQLKAKGKELEGKTQKNFGKLQENLDDAV